MNLYVRAIRRECGASGWLEMSEVQITRFDASTFDAAMDLADQLYAAHKDQMLDCAGKTEPEWYIDAFFGDSESQPKHFVYEYGKRLLREKLIVNRRTVFASNNSSKACNIEVVALREFASDVLYDAITFARTYAEKQKWPLGSGTVTCGLTVGGTIVLFKDDIIVQMMRDGNYVGKTLFSVQQDKGKGSGLVKTNVDDTDDTNPPVASSASEGPSFWQIVGVLGLAGAIGYGAWKVTGMIVAKEPSRSFR